MATPEFFILKDPDTAFAPRAMRREARKRPFEWAWMLAFAVLLLSLLTLLFQVLMLWRSGADHIISDSHNGFFASVRRLEGYRLPLLQSLVVRQSSLEQIDIHGEITPSQASAITLTGKDVDSYRALLKNLEMTQRLLTTFKSDLTEQETNDETIRLQLMTWQLILMVALSIILIAIFQRQKNAQMDTNIAHTREIDKDTSKDGERLPTFLKIIAADDHPINRQYLQALLKKMGHQSEIYEDGQALVNRLSQPTNTEAPFDVVLIDYQMPVMDGLSATRAIRALPSLYADVRVVLLTVEVTENTRKEAQLAGVDVFAKKPLSVETLQKIFSIMRLSAPLTANQAINDATQTTPTYTPPKPLLDKETLFSATEDQLPAPQAIVSTSSSKGSLAKPWTNKLSATSIFSDLTDDTSVEMPLPLAPVEAMDTPVVDAQKLPLWLHYETYEEICKLLPTDRLTLLLNTFFKAKDGAIHALMETLTATTHENAQETLIFHAHKLQGVAQQMGFLALSHIASTIEERLRNAPKLLPEALQHIIADEEWVVKLAIATKNTERLVEGNINPPQKKSGE